MRRSIMATTFLITIGDVFSARQKKNKEVTGLLRMAS